MARDFTQAIQNAIEQAKQRSFNQSVDVIIHLQNLDLSDPTNRLKLELQLPYPPADDVTICAIGDTFKNTDAVDKELSSEDLDDLADDKNAVKKLAEECDHFIAEAPLMPRIGKDLGQVLGPRNKMPKPMPPNSDPTGRVDALKKTINIKMREAPHIQCRIGKENADLNTVVQNAEAVYNAIRNKLPAGEANIKDIQVKLTMGPVVSVQ